MKKPWVLSYPLSAQRRLIRLGEWVFAGCTVTLLVLSCRGSYVYVYTLSLALGWLRHKWMWDDNMILLLISGLGSLNLICCFTFEILVLYLCGGQFGSLYCFRNYLIESRVCPDCFVLFVLEFYGPVNNEVMSSRSVNSGTFPGQA